MIEPKPEDDPAALEELPAGEGAGNGVGGAGTVPPDVEVSSLSLAPPRNAVSPLSAAASTAGIGVVAIQTPRPISDATADAATACCRAPLGECPKLDAADPDAAGAALLVVLQPRVPAAGVPVVKGAAVGSAAAGNPAADAS
jgi:hypothetical protein